MRKKKQNEYNDYGFQPEYESDGPFAPEPEQSLEEIDRNNFDLGGASNRPQKKLKWVLLIGGIIGFVGLFSVFLLTNGNRSNPNKDYAQKRPAKQIEAGDSKPAKEVRAQSASLQDALNSLVLIIVKTRSGETFSGSGFLVNKENLLLTNAHVVEDGLNIFCQAYNGEKSIAHVLARDKELDLALLKTDESLGIPTVMLANSDDVTIGTDVMALGYPRASVLEKEPSITSGIISSIRQESGLTWLQIDAAVNPGNSGGPLIRKGTTKVIGVVTKKLTESEGIAFALPSSTCKIFVRNAMQH